MPGYPEIAGSRQQAVAAKSRHITYLSIIDDAKALIIVAFCSFN